MGYSTTLYAVDLEKLRAAVGSNDADLAERVRAVGRDPAAGVDPTQGPRIKVTQDSQIILNGKPVTLDEMKAGVRDPRWAGTNLYWYHERGQKSGQWSERGSFALALQQALAGTRLAGMLACNTEAELLAGWDDDELSEEQAALELIAGMYSRPEDSYGYGLELLCRVLGTKLGVMAGKGRLAALKLDSPLEKARLPVTMPPSDDFPTISYLSADEVRSEVDRLSGMDLAFPKNASITRDRQELLSYLRSVAQTGQAMVVFYY